MCILLGHKTMSFRNPFKNHEVSMSAPQALDVVMGEKISDVMNRLTHEGQRDMAQGALHIEDTGQFEEHEMLEDARQAVRLVESALDSMSGSRDGYIASWFDVLAAQIALGSDRSDTVSEIHRLISTSPSMSPYMKRHWAEMLYKMIPVGGADLQEAKKVLEDMDGPVTNFPEVIDTIFKGKVDRLAVGVGKGLEDDAALQSMRATIAELPAITPQQKFDLFSRLIKGLHEVGAADKVSFLLREQTNALIGQAKEKGTRVSRMSKILGTYASLCARNGSISEMQELLDLVVRDKDKIAAHSSAAVWLGHAATTDKKKKEAINHALAAEGAYERARGKEEMRKSKNQAGSPGFFSANAELSRLDGLAVAHIPAALTACGVRDGLAYIKDRVDEELVPFAVLEVAKMHADYNDPAALVALITTEDVGDMSHKNELVDHVSVLKNDDMLEQLAQTDVMGEARMPAAVAALNNKRAMGKSLKNVGEIFAQIETDGQQAALIGTLVAIWEGDDHAEALKQVEALMDDERVSERNRLVSQAAIFAALGDSKKMMDVFNEEQLDQMGVESTIKIFLQYKLHKAGKHLGR